MRKMNRNYKNYLASLLDPLWIMADQELQIVEGFSFFIFFYIHRIYTMYKETGAGFIGSPEFVGLPPRGPNDTARICPSQVPQIELGEGIVGFPMTG